jgi:hypothetical protein
LLNNIKIKTNPVKNLTKRLLDTGILILYNNFGYEAKFKKMVKVKIWEFLNSVITNTVKDFKRRLLQNMEKIYGKTL